MNVPKYEASHFATSLFPETRREEGERQSLLLDTLSPTIRNRHYVTGEAEGMRRVCVCRGRGSEAADGEGVHRTAGVKGGKVSMREK